MVNVEPFTNCIEQGGGHVGELPSLCGLLCLEERESKGLQDRKPVCCLLGQPKQALHSELVDNLLVEDDNKGLSVVVDFVQRNVPF